MRIQDPSKEDDLVKKKKKHSISLTNISKRSESQAPEN